MRRSSEVVQKNHYIDRLSNNQSYGHIPTKRGYGCSFVFQLSFTSSNEVEINLITLKGRVTPKKSRIRLVNQAGQYKDPSETF